MPLKVTHFGAPTDASASGNVAALNKWADWVETQLHSTRKQIFQVSNTAVSSGGGGGVTSVGLAMPKEFNVTGSPVTSAGTLTAAWAPEPTGYVLQSPPAGLSAWQGATLGSFLSVIGGGTLTVTQTPTTTTSFGLIWQNGGTNFTFPAGWTQVGTTLFGYKAISGTSPVSVSYTVGSQVDATAFISLFNGPAPSLVQSNTANSTSGSLAFSSPNTTGNTLVVAIRDSGFSPAGPISIVVSDSLGNVYNQIVNQSFLGKNAGSNIQFQTSVWVVPNCIGGSNSVSWAINGPGSLSTPSIVIMEFGALAAGSSIPFFAPLSTGSIPPINLASTGNGGVGGVLRVANGGTGVTTSTGTGSTVLSASPTFTGTVAMANETLSGKITNYNSVVTVANGVPSEYSQVNLTAQGANVTTTTLYAVPAAGAGLYRVNVYIVVSRAATTSSTLPDSQILFTDQDSGAVITVPLTPGNSGNTLTTFQQATLILNAKASTNIQYNIGQVTPYASSGVTTMQFAYRSRLEYLG